MPAKLHPICGGIALCVAPMAALAAPDGWSPLLEPAELAAMLEERGDIRVVHVSGDTASAAIPGAVETSYADWRGPSDNPGALREVAELEAEARRLGIESDTPVALVHSGSNATDMGVAARIYWTLKSMGVEDLALVNGGFAAWQEAGLPVADSVGQVTPSGFTAEWQEDWRVDTAEVERLVDSGEADLIDARPTGFFEGLVWSIARPGTIRGADNLTYEDWFEDDRMVDAVTARDIAERHGRTDAPLTVSFCNTGHWAAINWFALSELAEVDNTRLYAESMAEWTQAGRPLDNEPSRVTIFLQSTRDWVGDLF